MHTRHTNWLEYANLNPGLPRTVQSAAPKEPVAHQYRCTRDGQTLWAFSLSEAMTVFGCEKCELTLDEREESEELMEGD